MSRNEQGENSDAAQKLVTSREGRVSRNVGAIGALAAGIGVTSREGRVSRNLAEKAQQLLNIVTSREGRVSRNKVADQVVNKDNGHVPRGTCE